MMTLTRYRRIAMTTAVVGLALVGAGCGDNDGPTRAASAQPADVEADAGPATTLTATAHEYSFVDEAGGINVVDPGTTRTGYADLEPGPYVLLCFLPTPGGTSHLHEGMAAEVTVAAAPVVEAPAPVGDITLLDFGFSLPEGGLAEAGTYRVANEGQSGHEMAFMRVDEGKTIADVAAYLSGGFQGEQPLAFVGGAGGVEPGTDTYVDLDLEPGEYVAMCFLPDAATGKRHAELGMVTTFTVP